MVATRRHHIFSMAHHHETRSRTGALKRKAAALEPAEEPAGPAERAFTGSSSPVVNQLLSDERLGKLYSEEVGIDLAEKGKGGERLFQVKCAVAARAC